MTETYLPFCQRVDGPPQKQGYPGAGSRTLAEIEGEVDHSMEGPYTAALGELMNLARMASWHFSVRKAPHPPVQHYPLEAITWHCGLPGDRRQDTSLIGNLTLIGIEHEDYPTNALDDWQKMWTVEITKEIRALCPNAGRHPPLLRVNLWEHNWLSSTSCPSGLIPWAWKIAQLEEDDMPHTETENAQVDAMIGHLLNIDATDDQILAACADMTNKLNTLLAAPPSGLSEAQVRAIVRQEINKTKLSG